MGRNKKVAFTVMNGTEQCSCKDERELLATLSTYEDLSDILVFAGAPLSVERNVTFALNEGVAARGPGRPPGSKAKRKGKKRQGRPKGSKNKKQKATAAPKAGKKRPGRPKGSKNKKAAKETEATVANILQQAAQSATPVQATPAPPAPAAAPAVDVTK